MTGEHWQRRRREESVCGVEVRAEGAPAGQGGEREAVLGQDLGVGVGRSGETGPLIQRERRSSVTSYRDSLSVLSIPDLSRCLHSVRERKKSIQYRNSF